MRHDNKGWLWGCCAGAAAWWLTGDAQAQAADAAEAAGGAGVDIRLISVVVSVATALAALLFSAYTRWRSANQAYYAHLSKVWYDLRKQEADHPAWLDPEVTSLYGVGQNGFGPSTITAYDVHAWACWALAEDWYETFGRSLHARRERGGLWPQAWRPRNELAQFESAVRGVTELHWPWLRLARHRCRFDEGFIDWIEREFIGGRVELRTGSGVLHGTGVVALQTLPAGRFVGHFHGEVTTLRGPHTLQIGEHRHLEAKGLMKYLNHADEPNAVVRGLSVFALRSISAGEEVTLDYNCTEDEFRFDDGPMQGYLHLTPEQRLARQPYLHIWIRERASRMASQATQDAALALHFKRSCGVDGQLTAPVSVQEIEQALERGGVAASAVRLPDAAASILVPGRYAVEVTSSRGSATWIAQVDAQAPVPQA